MTAAYRSLWRLPGVPAQAACGLLAQVTQQVAPVGTVLVVEAATDSLAVAGLAAAGISIGTGVARPVQGRSIDRRGPRPVLVVSGLVHTAALVGLVLAAGGEAPGWILVALATVAGIALPPVSVAMRVAWGQRVPAASRTAAYSLVFLVQELAILAGPLGFGVIVATAAPRPALAAVAAVAGAGALALARTLHPIAGTPPAATARVSALRNGDMRLLLGVVLLLGGSIGALEVGLPALALDRGVPAASGVLIAAVSLGGIAGALGYGALTWTVRPATRLVALLAALGAALAPIAVLGPLPVVGAALFLSGVALNPALTTTSLIVDGLPTAPAEAFGWLSTAISVGAAAAAGLTGVLGQYAGPSSSLLLPALLALAGAALALPLRQTVIEASPK